MCNLGVAPGWRARNCMKQRNTEKTLKKTSFPCPLAQPPLRFAMRTSRNRWRLLPALKDSPSSLPSVSADRRTKGG